MTPPPGADTVPVAARRRSASRDFFEGIVSAVILVLIIRHFAFEVFKIPTGSMAPTLLGQHRDVDCPNCRLRYAIDAPRPEETVDAVCPNCFYRVPSALMDKAVCTCFPAQPKAVFSAGGNRVIVNKFLCGFDAAERGFRPPDRWDIVVFRFPYASVRCLSPGCRRFVVNVPDTGAPFRCPECGSRFVWVDQPNYIKRLVGLPGEEVRIRHGDIYANGLLQRKPFDVQESVWQLVYDSAHRPIDAQPGADPRWVANGGSFADGEGGLVITPPAGGPARVRYAAPITDFAAYIGDNRDAMRQHRFLPELPAGLIDLYPVGDLRWEARVRLDGPGQLRLNIREDGRLWSAAVQFGDRDARTAIELNGVAVTSVPLTFKPGVERDILFWNADGHVELRVDGAPLLAHDEKLPLDEVTQEALANGAAIEVLGAPAHFPRVRLHRDLYYTRPGVYQVAPKGCFALGDNTRNSADSRSWGPERRGGSFPAANLLGDAVVVWWPFGDMKGIR
jgi:signal peptidase I